MVNLFKLRLQTEYLRFLLKRNARYMFIMSIAMLTLYPVLGITIKILSRASTYDTIREVGLFFNIALLLLTAFLIPLQVHSYMNSKKNLDVYHALPIRRQDLYLTSLLASVLIIDGPFTVGWFSGGLLMMNNTFTFLVILERYVALLAIAIAILSVVLFTMMNTGTSLDAFLYSVTLNFLPILAYGAYILFVQTILLGFTIGDLTKYIAIIFPIYALFDSGFALKTGMWDSGYVNAFYWLIVSGIFLAVANQFYLRRKSEKAEKPFTNKTFFPVVSGLVVILFIIFAYCVIYNMNTSTAYTSFYNPINFIFPLFFSAVLYLMLDAIAERGFKHLAKAFLTYLIIAAVAVAILVGGIATKGFGYAARIPSLDNIESVDLAYNDYMSLVIPVPQASYSAAGSSLTTNTDTVLNFTAAEDIQAVYALHKVIIAEYKWVDYNYGVGGSGNLIQIIEDQPGYQKSYTPLPFNMYNQYMGNTARLKITYHLKNGGEFQRNYQVPTEWTGSLLKLNNSSEIVKLIAPNLAYADTHSKVTSAEWSTPISKTTLLPSLVNLQALKTAYLQDLANLSDAQSISTEYTALGTLTLRTCTPTSDTNCYGSGLDIDTRYAHVVSVLTSAGIIKPAASEIVTRAVLVIPSQSSVQSSSNPFFKVALGQATGRFAADVYRSTGNQTADQLTYVTLTHDEMIQILSYVSQKGISQDPLMNLVLENSSGNLLVQAQYTDEVNAIIAGKPRLSAMDIYSLFNATPSK